MTETPENQTSRREGVAIDEGGVPYRNPDSEYPTVRFDIETGETVVSGPGHHGLI